MKSPAFYPFSLLRNPHPLCLPSCSLRGCIKVHSFSGVSISLPSGSLETLLSPLSSDSTSASLLAPSSYTVKFIKRLPVSTKANQHTLPVLNPNSLFLVSIPNQCSVPYLKLQVGSVSLPVSLSIYNPISVPPFY